MSEHISTASAFNTMFKNFMTMNDMLYSGMASMTAHFSSMNPGKFLVLQFAMGQVTQVGEAISNMLSQTQSINSNSIRNFKGG